MSAVALRSDSPLPRVAGGLRARFAASGGITHLAQLHQHDGYRLRLPHSAHGLDAVMINTGGGVAGGDRITHEFHLGEGASALITSQAAERIYRARDALPARITTRLELAPGTSAIWLPQETIVYSGARLHRSLEVSLPADAQATICEILIFGRHAMGETLGPGLIRDDWRVYRAGRLIYQEALRLDGDIGSLLVNPFCAAGAQAIACILHVSPMAEDRLAAIRAGVTLQGMAASAWDGKLVVRAVAHDAAALRGQIARLMPILSGRAMPRIWWS